MHVDIVSGLPLPEPAPPKPADPSPRLQQQARQGAETETLVASSDGQAIVDKLSALLVADLTRLVTASSDEAEDRTQLAAIRGAYRALAALGYEMAVGRLAAAKLAEQAMPMRDGRDG